jgi:site-specific DNA recombinase
VDVVTVQGGQWNWSTANGQLNARMLGSTARRESDHKSKRVRRVMQQNAVAGRAYNRRAYGWRREYAADGTSREVIVPAEAAVVRQIAEVLLSGTPFDRLLPP